LTLGLPRSGEARFARYAYPPNELGYCGAGDGAELLEVARGQGAREIRSSAMGFEGAWPYLEMLAGVNDAADPLDDEVVEAYWVGNSLLDRVDPVGFAEEVRRRFASQTGADWQCLTAVPTPVPHHSFHVFAIYPWAGLLRAGRRGPALEVLERCRIGWGEVVGVEEDRIDVHHQSLDFDGQRFFLGDYRTETYRWQHGSDSLSGQLSSGDWVTTHWGWACERLSAVQVAALSYFTLRQLDVTNSVVVEMT
jgi:Family of unknown function (DUF6390)